MDVLVTYRRIYYANVLVRNAESKKQVRELLDSDDRDVAEFFDYGEDEAFLNSDEFSESEVWDVFDTEGHVPQHEYDAEIDLDELEDISDGEEEPES